MAFHYMIIYGFFITYHWSESEHELPDDSVICARSRKQSDWGVKDEGVTRKLKRRPACKDGINTLVVNGRD